MEQYDGTKLYAKQIELIVDDMSPPLGPPAPPATTPTQKLKLYNITTLLKKFNFT